MIGIILVIEVLRILRSKSQQSIYEPNEKIRKYKLNRFLSNHLQVHNLSLCIEIITYKVNLYLLFVNYETSNEHDHRLSSLLPNDLVHVYNEFIN